MTLHDMVIHPAPGYDSSHECPHPRCAERVQPEGYACPVHFAMLPPAVRAEIRQAVMFDDNARRWAAENEADRWLKENAR